MSRTSIVLEDALSELIDHRGKTPKKLGGDWSPSGHRVVSAINIKGSRVDDNDHHYVDDTLYARWMKVPLRAGDVLLTSEAPTGEVAFIDKDEDWCLGQRVFGLRARPGVLDGRYLFYELRGGDARNQLFARATGTTVSGIRQSELVKVRLELPGIDEQRGIADTLGALDDAIDSAQRVIDLALRLLDAYSATLSETITDSVPLGVIARATRKTADPSDFAEQPVDHFSIPAFDAANWPDRVPASHIGSNKIEVRQPSILISRLNPRFNRTWWCVPEAGTPALASTEFLTLTGREGVTMGALWLAIRDEYFRSELQRRVTGTSGSHQRIRPDDALSIDVPDVRQLDDEDRERASELLDLVHQRRAQIRRLMLTRDELMPQLLGGKIRVAEALEKSA